MIKTALFIFLITCSVIAQMKPKEELLKENPDGPIGITCLAVYPGFSYNTILEKLGDAKNFDDWGLGYNLRMEIFTPTSPKFTWGFFVEYDNWGSQTDAQIKSGSRTINTKDTRRFDNLKAGAVFKFYFNTSN